MNGKSTTRNCAWSARSLDAGIELFVVFIITLSDVICNNVISLIMTWKCLVRFMKRDSLFQQLPWSTKTLHGLMKARHVYIRRDTHPHRILDRCKVFPSQQSHTKRTPTSVRRVKSKPVEEYYDYNFTILWGIKTFIVQVSDRRQAIKLCHDLSSGFRASSILRSLNVYCSMKHDIVLNQLCFIHRLFDSRRREKK